MIKAEPTTAQKAVCKWFTDCQCNHRITQMRHFGLEIHFNCGRYFVALGPRLVTVRKLAVIPIPAAIHIDYSDPELYTKISAALES